MRIKLKRVLNYAFGKIGNHSIIDIPDQEARKLIAAEWAEPVEEEVASEPEPQAEPVEIVELKPETPKRYSRRHDQ